VARRDELESGLRQIIRDGVASGVFGTDDPDECSRAVLVMCQGIALWYHPEGPRTANDIAHRYVRFSLAIAEYHSGL
jgi:hypothetical protein